MADLDLSTYSGDEFNIIGREIVKETVRTRTRGLAAVVERTLIPFTGTFDGYGHTISNFTYTCRDGDKVSLFGYVADPNARISNLELIDSRIFARGGENIGCLAGRLDDGMVVNCHVYLERILTDGASYAGALVGHVRGGTLADCRSTTSFVVCQGGAYVGTLAGYLRKGTLRRYHADDGLVLAEDNVGGLLGYVHSYRRPIRGWPDRKQYGRRQKQRSQQLRLEQQRCWGAGRGRRHTEKG